MESKASSSSNSRDHLLKCPLSLDFIEDPVIMRGHTYDRKHLCNSLLTYPNLDPVTNTRFDKRASYSDNIAIRQLLMEDKGDAAYKKYDDSYFVEAYEKAWNKLMSGMFLKTAVPMERMIIIYQKIDEYVNGMNRKKIDMEKAYEMIIDAPDSGSNAIMNIWKAYFADPQLPRYKSISVEKSETRANAFYRKAVVLNIERMAETGDQYAQACLGWMYENGRGVNNNNTTAIYWYRKAAEQGHATAQNDLGYMYQNGLGVNRNYSIAVEWFRKAAEQGYAAAQTNLGHMYHNGLGVNRNYSSAVEWYRKAAEQGHANGQYNLGWMYQNGLGVTKHYFTASGWYRKAAEQGYATA